MSRFTRARKAPPSDDIAVEAAKFRAESELLRRELNSLRVEIMTTMSDLDRFSRTMKGNP